MIKISIAGVVMVAGLIFMGGFPVYAQQSSGTRHIPEAAHHYAINITVNKILHNVMATHGRLSTSEYHYLYQGLISRKFGVGDAVASLVTFIQAQNLTSEQKHQLKALCVGILPKPYPGDTNDGYDVRPRAITLLGLLGDKSAVPDLIPLLSDSDDRIRITAKNALNELGHLTTQNVLY